MLQSIICIEWIIPWIREKTQLHHLGPNAISWYISMSDLVHRKDYFWKNLLWVEVVWLQSGFPPCERTKTEAVHMGSLKAPLLQCGYLVLQRSLLNTDVVHSLKQLVPTQLPVKIQHGKAVLEPQQTANTRSPVPLSLRCLRQQYNSVLRKWRSSW